MAEVSRRQFLGAAAAGTAAFALSASEGLAAVGSAPVPIIDSHIHLFDGTRPIGTEYKGSAAYAAQWKVSLPSMYEPLAKPTGIVGAIVVESSSWIDENLWYLEVCRADPFMVGVCGALDPTSPQFWKYVEHFAKDPLYRAIRYRASRIYEESGERVMLKPVCVENLKLLAQADLALDTANPSIGLMRANVLLADAVPNLRIVMDHLPSFDPDSSNQEAYEAVVKDMAARPNIFVKLTEVYHPRLADGTVVRDYGLLRGRLEHLYDAFGDNRVIFGTDYPNSYGVATIPESVEIMRRFFGTRSREAAERYFWRNSARVYKWKPRTPEQPAVA